MNKSHAKQNEPAIRYLYPLKEEKQWIEWLDGKAYAAFRQTPAWAQINRAVNGDISYALTTGHGAGALLSFREKHRKNAGLARKLLRLDVSRTLDCRDGPIFSETAPPAEIKSFLDQVDTLAHDLGVSKTIFWGSFPGDNLNMNETLRHTMEDNGYMGARWETATIDLLRSEEDIFDSFDHAARKGIRKCEKEGIKIVECQSRSEFQDLFLKPAMNTKGKNLSSEEVGARSALFDIGFPTYYSFLSACNRSGIVLAVLGTYRFNGLAAETTSAVTAEGLESKIPAQDLLHWHALKRHRNLGDRLFDLAGFSPNPETPKEQGIRRFKLKWGGLPQSIFRFEKNYR